MPSEQRVLIFGLLADISGTVGRVFTGPYGNVFEVRVPSSTEQAAIRRAYADSNVVHAGLSLKLVGAL